MVTESQAWKEITGAPAAAGYTLAVAFLAFLGVALVVFRASFRERVRRWRVKGPSPIAPAGDGSAPASARPEPPPSAPDAQALHAAVAAATPDLVCVYDLTSRATVFANRDCDALLGFENQILHYHFLRERLHAEDVPVWEEHLGSLRHAPDGDVVRAEYRLQHRDGHYVWVCSRSRVFGRDSNGVPSQAMVNLQDHTGERLGREKLLAAQQQHLSVMASVNEVIFQTDNEGKLLFLNPAWTEITGFTTEESLGLFFFEYVHAEDKDRYWMLFLPLITKQQAFCRHEVRFITKGGGFRWMETRARLTVNKNNQVTGISGTLTDVTERRVAEDKLRNSEQLYRLISENARDLITLADERGRALYISPSVREVLGFSVEELLGTDPFKYMYPGDVAAIRHETHHIAGSNDLHQVLEYRTRRKDGKYIWLQTHIRPIMDEHGRLVNLQTTSRDITDRKQAEEKLRESEQLYRLISENAKDLVALHTPGGAFRYLSPSIAEITGYTAAEVLGATPFACIHPEDVAIVKAAFGNATSSESHSQQYRARHKMGHYIWLETQLRPILGASGRVEAVQTSTRDISNRKLAEQSVTRMSSLLISILDNSLTGVMAYQAVRNAEGQVIDLEWQLINRKAGTMLGLNPDELIGQRLLEVLPRVRTTLFEPYKRVVEEGTPWEEENYSIGPHDARRFHLVAVNIGDGCAVMCTDVTRQKQLQDATTLQKERMEQVYRITSNAAFDTSTQVYETLKAATGSLGLEIGIFSCIADGAFTIQEAYTAYPGFPRGLVLPVHTTYCSIPYGENRLVAIAGMPGCEYRDHPCYAVHRFEAYIGVPVWIRGRKYGVLMFAAYHSLPGGISQGDCDFVQMLSQWIGTVLERSMYETELIHAKEQAEYSARAKEQFLSTMSHEIRTPMNAVIGMTHLLMQENPKPEQVGNLKMLQFSAENLLVLINDILDYNKIESGMVSFECIPFNLAGLLESIRFSLGLKAEEKHIGFDIGLDGQLPPVLLGDPVRLAQILTNLVSNAIKFTEKGHVTLDAVLKRDDGDSVVLDFAVTDTGIGIKAEKLAYIFDRFTQAESDTTRKYGGTGLGLAITKRLLEMQGSQIGVDSRPGEGSRFFFSLAFRKGDEDSPVRDRYAYTTTARLLDRVQLLLVEDNEINRKVATKFLNKWGIQPDYAHNGVQAIEKIREKEYDLILMDLQMPEMDGYEAARIIRETKAQQGIPIIALTASAMHDVAQKIFDAGMNDFVMKPFHPDDLYQKIAKYAAPDQAGPAVDLPPAAEGLAPGSDDVLELTGLVEIAGEGTDFLQEMIRMHIKMFGNFPEEYSLALEQKDVKGLHFIFHRTKSSCAMLRITRLEDEYAVAKALLASRENVREALEASAGRVKVTCLRITRRLQQELDRLVTG
jgi:PAS domain S-box-containing protein